MLRQLFYPRVMSTLEVQYSFFDAALQHYFLYITKKLHIASYFYHLTILLLIEIVRAHLKVYKCTNWAETQTEGNSTSKGCELKIFKCMLCSKFCFSIHKVLHLQGSRTLNYSLDANIESFFLLEVLIFLY